MLCYVTGLQFWNNSAIKFHDKISALRILHNNYNHHKQSLFNMSLCSFYNNHGGYDMLTYAVEGKPSMIIMIDRCTFYNNNYSNALLRLEAQTKVLVLSNLNFTANTNKEGVVYIFLYSTNFSVFISMYNIILERNFDTSAGGVVLRYNSNDYSVIQASKLNFTNNHFIGDGGGINILGTLHKG